MKQPILETERLILRSPRMSDWGDLVKGIGDFEIAKHLAAPPYPYKKKHAIGWINKKIKEAKEKEKTGYTFVIELKSEKKLIGCIDLMHIDYINGLSETGSWINKKYQRKGYISEAKIAVNEFAFNTLKLRRLESRIFSENNASNATQKSAGYKYEGTRKKRVICKATGKIHDESIYGLLKEDWKKNLPKLKKHLNDKIKKLDKEENKK